MAQTYVLHFTAGKYEGGRYALRPNSELIMGRSSEVEMTMIDTMVSRRHARLTTYHGVIVLEDMGSANGTYVNGQRITSHIQLKVGDTILVGENALVLALE